MTLLSLLTSLAEAPLRTCRSLHECVICTGPIYLGEQYRDRGYARRAHEDCFQSAAKRLIAACKTEGGTA